MKGYLLERDKLNSQFVFPTFRHRVPNKTVNFTHNSVRNSSLISICSNKLSYAAFFLSLFSRLKKILAVSFPLFKPCSAGTDDRASSNVIILSFIFCLGRFKVGKVSLCR